MKKLLSILLTTANLFGDEDCSNYIVDKMYSIFYFKLTADEIAELKGYTMDKLYELLKTDRQDLRKEKQCQKK